MGSKSEDISVKTKQMFFHPITNARKIRSFLFFDHWVLFEFLPFCFVLLGEKLSWSKKILTNKMVLLFTSPRTTSNLWLIVCDKRKTNRKTNQKTQTPCHSTAWSGLDFSNSFSKPKWVICADSSVSKQKQIFFSPNNKWQKNALCWVIFVFPQFCFVGWKAFLEPKYSHICGEARATSCWQTNNFVLFVASPWKKKQKKTKNKRKFVQRGHTHQTMFAVIGESVGAIGVESRDCDPVGSNFSWRPAQLLSLQTFGHVSDSSDSLVGNKHLRKSETLLCESKTIPQFVWWLLHQLPHTHVRSQQIQWWTLMWTLWLLYLKMCSKRLT